MTRLRAAHRFFCAKIFFAAILAALSCAHNSAKAQTAFDDPMASAAGSGGTLVLVEPAITTGEIALGSTTQAIVRFRNDAGQPVTFGKINIYPSSNVTASVTLNQCEAAPLPFGSECAIVMALKALKAGAFQTQMLIEHSGRAKLITATISGTVAEGDVAAGEQAVNEVQAAPASLNFGTLEASRPMLRTIQLRNTTSDTIQISDVIFDSPQKSGFDIRSACKELAAGQSCLLSVVWSPVLPGPTSGFIVVQHSGTSKLTNIPVEGVYTPKEVSDVTKYPSPVPGKGLLIASAEAASFGEEVDVESAFTITLVNSGDHEMTIEDINFSVPTAGLTIDPSGCKKSSVLAPSDACPLTLRWAPQKIGALKTDMRITHDGARGVLVIPVSGRSSAIVQSSMIYDGGEGEASLMVGSGNLTDLPGSAGLTLDDIAQLNSALSGEMADVIDRSTGSAQKKQQTAENARYASAAGTMSSYIITTHSINRAIIMGPEGSHIVTHNKPITIGGVSWIPQVTPEGLDMMGGNKIVSLSFDPSLGTNKDLLTDNLPITDEEASANSDEDSAEVTQASTATAVTTSTTTQSETSTSGETPASSAAPAAAP